MKIQTKGYIYSFTILLGLCVSTTVLCQVPNSRKSDTIISFDDTRKFDWEDNFKVVNIPSKIDEKIQHAYFYKTTSKKSKPLLVSLHTWSGDYSQKDSIAKLAKAMDFNYIHPDFRGPNKTAEACGSELAITDIDESITYAINHANVDLSKIYVIGVSGGGFATLNTFMNSVHNIKKFSAWASITDLKAWYYESLARKNGYAEDILNCTGSPLDELDTLEAMKRSPLYVNTPGKKLAKSKLDIFAGVSDGVTGSVPFVHSIHLYNKILKDLQVGNKKLYVSEDEINALCKTKKPLGSFGQIGSRKICLIKRYKNIRLIIFEGGHEMLTEFAFKELVTLR